VPNYDSLDCAAQWAKDSLNLHRSDKREHIYTRYGRPVAECVCADGSGLSVVDDGMCTLLHLLCVEGGKGGGSGEDEWVGGRIPPRKA